MDTPYIESGFLKQARSEDHAVDLLRTGTYAATPSSYLFIIYKNSDFVNSFFVFFKFSIKRL